MERIFSNQVAEQFRQYLYEDEKSPVTVEKYMRDIYAFSRFIGTAEITKSDVLAYKEKLGGEYAVASANSMIAAVNQFFRFCGWHDLCIKQFRVQKKAFCPAERELTRAEYLRLVNTAKAKHNERLSLLIETICATGIRIGELPFITAEAAKNGQAIVSCKGKTRTVFIVSSLQKKLLKYTKEHGILSGAVFITRTGKPMSRCNIWKEMKSLCKEAGVIPGKVFPHNLRHLFARTFYGLEKDIAKLADILGHTNINTTRIYIVTTGAEHRRKMENMRLVI